MEDHGVPPPKRLDYRRDGWFAFRFATQPWRSITRERLPRQRWSVDGKRVQLTVQNSHYPTFVGKGKVSWPDGSPTQRKTSLSCPAGRIVVLHTFGSRTAMARVDLPTLKELMGHSTITMTMRYVHPTPEHKLEAVRKLEQFNAEQLFALYEQKGSPQKSPQSATN